MRPRKLRSARRNWVHRSLQSKSGVRRQVTPVEPIPDPRAYIVKRSGDYRVSLPAVAKMLLPVLLVPRYCWFWSSFARLLTASNYKVRCNIDV